MSEQTQKAIEKANGILKTFGLDETNVYFQDSSQLPDHLVAFWGIADYLVIPQGEINEDSIRLCYLKVLERVKTTVDESIAAVSKL